MTSSEEEGAPGADRPKIRLVDRDRVQVEFLIDDLIRQIKVEGIRPVVSCNGCNSCSAAAPEVDR
ncbi:hypothetical protein [Sphaerisporangium fuscum]|uniref:hypothetical protein n=1 Tax=Sphaerisporangium fuscum TaxID=2835868 RepID=UPI001BDC78E2|nr:hypothetical protein [Sphaerisporangium fuscum]